MAYLFPPDFNHHYSHDAFPGLPPPHRRPLSAPVEAPASAANAAATLRTPSPASFVSATTPPVIGEFVSCDFDTSSGAGGGPDFKQLVTVEACHIHMVSGSADQCSPKLPWKVLRGCRGVRGRLSQAWPGAPRRARAFHLAGADDFAQY